MNALLTPCLLITKVSSKQSILLLCRNTFRWQHTYKIYYLLGPNLYYSWKGSASFQEEYQIYME